MKILENVILDKYDGILYTKEAFVKTYLDRSNWTEEMEDDFSDYVFTDRGFTLFEVLSFSEEKKKTLFKEYIENVFDWAKDNCYREYMGFDELKIEE